MQGLKGVAGVELLPLDLNSAASISDAVAQVVGRAGRIDILVNNAGVVTLGPATEVPLDAARQCFESNVFGLLSLCQAVFPVMASQGSGKIVNVGSLTGFLPVPLRGVYAASKAAVMRLTDSMRLECAPLGIKVMLVSPGFVSTNARSNAKCAADNYNSTGGGPTTDESMWTGWFDVLEESMGKVAKKAVPAEKYAAELVAVSLRPSLPRNWVGPCAGLEWVVRYLPPCVQDYLLYRSLGLGKLEPVLLENAAALRKQPAVSEVC